jgi:hypothetical protein
MGVPTSELSYTSATKNGRGDDEVHKGHVVALEGGGDLSEKYSSQISSSPADWGPAVSCPVLVILESLQLLPGDAERSEDGGSEVLISEQADVAWDVGQGVLQWSM